MVWKTFFSQTILMRGLDYYRRGKVIELTSDGDSYTAKVTGSRVYSVHIMQKDGSLYTATCDCPHSRSGYFCKHVAASLFAIDEREREEANREMKRSPFESLYDGDGEGVYRYFDMRRITRNGIFYEDTFKRAQRLLSSGKLTNVNLRYDYRDGSENGGMVCVASACFRTDYDNLIRVKFDRDGVLESLCEKYVPGFGMTGIIYRGSRFLPNQYILALLMKAAEQLRSAPDAGDSTSGLGIRLLDSFRADRLSGSLGELKREISLEPRLTAENGRYYLTLRAGYDKMYVVKNLTEFVGSVEERSEYMLGKQQISFSRDTVSEGDEALYRFVRDSVTDVAIRAAEAKENGFGGYASGSRGVTESVRNRIELYGSRMDGFFDAAVGREISFTEVIGTGKSTSRLRVCSGSPDISLDIRKDVDSDGVFHGIMASGRAPVFIAGSRCHYFIDGGRFCRVSEEAQRRIRPLYVLLGRREFSFSVGRNNLAEFYYSVLPGLRDMIKVSESQPDEIEKYLPPEAVMEFYLDAEERRLTCRAAARYGDVRFPLTDSAAGDHAAMRESRRESEALDVVKAYFDGFDKKQELFTCPRGEEAEYRLLSEGLGELLRIGEVSCTDRFKAIKIRRRLPVQVGVSVTGDLMNLTIESDDVSLRELAAILKSYRQKKRYHRLRNGDFVDVDRTVAELSDMVETLRLSPAELAKGSVKLPVYRALYLDQMSEKCEALRIDRDSRFKRIVKEFKTVGESDFEVPEHLRDVMRGYQVFGHRWLRTLEKYGFGGILADDMGLGKTLQIISVLSSAKAEGEKGVSLVVCPASLIYNWLEELARFAPELSAVAVAGSQSERAEIVERIDGYDVAVTSYDLLKRDIALYENRTFNYEVIDEAQYIKNQSTAAAKAVKVITSRVRFALTGTPIENRLSELWSIFDYLMPGFLYGYETFRKELEMPITKKNDPSATEKLRRMTSPFILRRLKSDVLKDLPDKIEEVRYAAFDTEQRRLYDAQAAYMKGMLQTSDQAEINRSKIRILAELTRIRQICCDPSLLYEDYDGGSAKRSVCAELVRSAIEGEHRVLLFSQFTSMIELLERDLAEEGIPYYKIIGATPKQERVELVRQFNSGDVPVFLISLKAGGTGLNLTGADVVIHYDPWWNVAAQNQATDRAHRIGQTRIVSVYRIIAKNTIEEKILELQQTKQHLADEILSGELGGIGSMTREELLELLS